MIKNYLVIACRILLRNRTFSIINILGLAVGMTASLFILQYVQFEKSYDSFNAKSRNIFRVSMDRYVGGEFKFKSARTYPAMAPRLKENFAEVEDYVRIFPDHGILADATSNKRFNENSIFLADASFFNIFSVQLDKGTSTQALVAPNSIVLSESLAAKYFADEDPLGKILDFYKDDSTHETYKVTGVFADIPGNSHLKFNALVSYSTLLSRYSRNDSEWKPSEDSWQVDEYYTYVLLNDGTDPLKLEGKLPAFFDRYKGDLFKARNVREELHLQPLRDIHLHSDLRFEISTPGNYKLVNYLEMIGVFILVIAWINYVNLTTAKASGRAREIGIRKVFGSQKLQLVKQFLFESAFTNFLALVLSLVLYEVSLPFFILLTGLQLKDSVFELRFVVEVLGALSLLGVILSSLYPALMLAGFKPATALKGRIVPSQQAGFNLRKALVFFQFITAMVMIGGIMTIRNQVDFMKNQDLGFDPEQLMIVKAASFLPENTDDAYETQSVSFKNRLLQHSQIMNVTESGFIPGQEIVWQQGLVRAVHAEPGAADSYHVFAVDERFFETYEMKIVAGQVFTMSFHPSDALIINETAAQRLGFANPQKALGEEIFVEVDGHDRARVAGVIEDYHHLSLRNDFQPQIFFYRAATWSYFTVKLAGKNLQEEIDIVNSEFAIAFPGNPFDYFFLGQFFNDQYQADQRFEKTFGIFSLLAIFICALGLFGLSSYTIGQRTKETGIHKVLGASAADIITLLSKDIVRLLLLAGIVALPITYAIADHWLEGYAFHVDITWSLLLMPIAIALVLAAATIGFQTIRAARANPINSLRSE